MEKEFLSQNRTFQDSRGKIINIVYFKKKRYIDIQISTTKIILIELFLNVSLQKSKQNLN